MAAKHQLVVVRHGESLWNKSNQFTGWYDADLSDKGIAEAKLAGETLKDQGFVFDVAFTSVQKRAIKTLNSILEETDLHWIPVHKCWRLNERMYGALTGLNKSETAKKYGEDQVKVWRRSYDTPPPPVEKSSPHYPGNDSRYKSLKPEEIPLSECLENTVNRTLPYWHSEIAPAIKSGKRVLISAHGNSLRGLVSYLKNLTNEQVIALNIPTGIPLLFELDEDLKYISDRYLMDESVVNASLAAVDAQGKAK